MGFLDNIENNRIVNGLKRTTDKVLSYEEKFKDMSDEDLKDYMTFLKDRCAKGESLEKLLPETYALVRESSARVLGMRHYPVQIMGGVALNNGDVAEMATGEGKTLVATLPTILNALTGKNIHVITSNEYLAKRDAEQMSKLYNFLGFSTGVSLSGQTVEEKKQAYGCNITYTTNTELGFDYLRDNLATREENRVMRGLNYVIVDELDDTLIDEARTPLILSTPNKDFDVEMLKRANDFAQTLKSGDYEIDLQTFSVILTDKGGEKADKFFGVENIYDMTKGNYLYYIRNALKANFLMEKGVEYVVEDGEVKIVNASTGRTMQGRRYSEGLHQAIEIKENVEIKEETVAKSQITFQSFFGLYKKIGGMTGTAKTDEEELRQMYGLRVVSIATNKPKQRDDEATKVFATEDAKYEAIIEDVMERQAKGQPILIGTTSVEKSQLFSIVLDKLGIPHQVLNATNHEEEGKIIAQAGRLGCVTIATNMAGRGTDISLGGNATYMAKEKMKEIGYSDEMIYFADSTLESDNEKLNEARETFKILKKDYKLITDKEKEEVKALGGLRVIGTELYESRRVDNQLRGRAGRQGDPGSSQFFVSLQDEIFRKYGTDSFEKAVEKANLDEEAEVTDKKVLKYVENIQQIVESNAYASRKYVVKFDRVINAQRKLVFEKRNQLLKTTENDEYIKRLVFRDMTRIVNSLTSWVGVNKLDYDALKDCLNKYKLDLKFLTPAYVECEEDELIERLTEDVFGQYIKQRDIVESKEPLVKNIERKMLLDQIDLSWSNQIREMEYLKESIGLKAYGGMDPEQEYIKEGSRLFTQVQEEIACETISSLLSFVGGKVDYYKNQEKEIEKTEIENNENQKKEEGKETSSNKPVKFPPEETQNH